MKQLLKHPIHLFSVGFGAGLVSIAPGTAGTLVGVVFYICLQSLSLSWYLPVVAILFIPGGWFCGVTARTLVVHDHPAIVWDEIVGFLITMIAVPMGWSWVLAGFILFRLFDIAKPWPIGIIDRHVRGGSVYPPPNEKIRPLFSVGGA